MHLTGANRSNDTLLVLPGYSSYFSMAGLSSISIAPSLFRRLGAILYDGLLLLALWFVTTALLLAVSGGQLADPHRPIWLLYALRGSLLLVTFMFFAWFWTHGGQTLGMRAWRLKLICASGDPVGWKQALWRFAAAILSLGAFGLGLFWMLFDRERCSVHDRLSGTRLVLLEKTAPGQQSVHSPQHNERQPEKK